MPEISTGQALTGIVDIANYLVTNSIWKSIFARVTCLYDTAASSSVNDSFMDDPKIPICHSRNICRAISVSQNDYYGEISLPQFTF
jgi:hypothetical protein